MGASYQKSWYPGFRSCVRGYSGAVGFIWKSGEKRKVRKNGDRTVDEIRRRFGYFSIQRAAMYQDKVYPT